MPTSYTYSGYEPSHSHSYLWRPIHRILRSLDIEKRAVDLGCGSGTTCNALSKLGFCVMGIDSSETGISVAKRTFPHINFVLEDAYDESLSRLYGTFPLVLSLEVIEHCIHPPRFVRSIYNLLSPGGTAIISTPYHGYLKNLSLALSGKLDEHFTVLWDGGHVKFFSMRTLRTMLEETGFRDIKLIRVGRFPPLAKSMIAVAQKL